MTGPALRTDAVGAGAGAVLARTSALLLDAGQWADEDMLPDGRIDSPHGPIAAHDVATGGAGLLAKVIVDVEAVMTISRGETLHRLGLWVAAQELAR